jgi:GxxExxY protein
MQATRINTDLIQTIKIRVAKHPLNQRANDLRGQNHHYKNNTIMLLIHEALTDEIIKAYYNVYNILGFGFLEKVYQNAMFLELRHKGFYVEVQKQIKVQFKGVFVGEYYADFIINEKVIIELKAAECLVKENEAQLINYLRGTNIEVGLLFNFGKKPEFKRKVFTNNIKSTLILAHG